MLFGSSFRRDLDAAGLNAMRLVDDVMEPFRPMVDLKVWQLQRNGEEQVTPDTKRALVRTLYDDMQTDAGATPVMVCIQKLATSLAQVYLGKRPLAQPKRESATQLTFS